MGNGFLQKAFSFLPSPLGSCVAPQTRQKVDVTFFRGLHPVSKNLFREGRVKPSSPFLKVSSSLGYLHLSLKNVSSYRILNLIYGCSFP
jgi:hypothetical protein